ncbi:MAG TPA: peptide-methionine (R)-S-oxide reductase, partial [Xanthomonadaceae bacterium]|nr:peptide-methionine (R)-S-oxide reductase [Xanthomonadaceae bacterium]
MTLVLIEPRTSAGGCLVNRRNVLQGLAALIALPLLPSWSRAAPPQAAAAGATGTGAAAVTAATAGRKVVPLKKPHAEWRKVLSPAAYAVLFEEGTERPFSSPLDTEKRAGSFLCAACYLPLFTSANKFDSGTGWPSFT